MSGPGGDSSSDDGPGADGPETDGSEPNDSELVGSNTDERSVEETVVDDSDDETDSAGGTERREQSVVDRAEDGSRQPDSGTDRPDVRTEIREHGDPIRWFIRTDRSGVVAVRDVVTSVAVVALIGLVLFGISGIWPPLVAIESGSMEPNMHRGDLVFIVDEQRFVGDSPVDDTGIVTLHDGAAGGHEQFGKPGDVIIFRPNGDTHRTPIIHRAHFWVEEGENWVETQADPEYVADQSCVELRHCPAPHDGFITKGDANRGYDQTERGAETTVVRPEWITGKAELRIPWLGYVRLTFDAIFGWTGPVSPVVDSIDTATIP